MQKMFFTLMMVVVLSSCATSVPVDIDISTSETLPKPMAISYLNSVTTQAGETWGHNRGDVPTCVFTEEGFFEHKDAGTLVKYDQSYMSLESRLARGDYFYYLFFVHPENKQLFYRCAITSVVSKDEKPEMFFNKIPTALKSLGVKVKTK